MVKVLQINLFTSHYVVPCEDEPIAVISAGDIFLVATLTSALHFGR